MSHLDNGQVLLLYIFRGRRYVVLGIFQPSDEVVCFSLDGLCVYSVHTEQNTLSPETPVVNDDIHAAAESSLNSGQFTQQPFHTAPSLQAGAAGQDGFFPPPDSHTNTSGHLGSLGVHTFLRSSPSKVSGWYLQDMMQQRDPGLTGFGFCQF